MTSQSTNRRVTVAAITGACLVLGATPALADHDHHIVTPGTCVTDVANGQTSKGEDEPGGHVFHTHVHTRTDSNGTRLDVLTADRVHVLKTSELDGYQLAACGL